jgi:hypothetical protein
MTRGDFRRMRATWALGVLAAAGAANGHTSESDSWQFAVTAYAYVPVISGTAYFPVAGVDANLNLNQSQLINSLEMAFMGSFDVHHGSWGAFSDVLYLDLGRHHTNIHDFTIGDVGIPANTNADISMNLKSWIVTAAGEYRVLRQGGSTLDVLAGLRYLSLNERLQWNFTGSIGSLPEAARSGDQQIGSTVVDGIVGVRGQLQGDNGWMMPFYLDVGTGGARFTWQGAIGLAYMFHWGEVGLLYRYLDFRFDSSKFQDLAIAGPMVSATFRW